MGSVCLCVCVEGVCIHFYTYTHTHRTLSSREFDRLTITSITTTRFRLIESDRNRRKLHFLRVSCRGHPLWTTVTSQTQMSNLPHAPKVWMLSLTTPRSTFPLLFRHRLSFNPPGHTRKFWRGKKSDHFRADSPVQKLLFSAQVTCSPARPRVFLYPRFPEENDARGCQNRDGIWTRLRFDSVLPSGEMSTKTRSAVICGLWDLPGLALSSRPSASSPLGTPLSSSAISRPRGELQLWLGTQKLIFIHSGVEFSNSYPWLNAFPCVCCIIPVVQSLYCLTINN